MKDPRYKIIKEKIEHGEITEFSQIFDFIPIEVVMADLDRQSEELETFHPDPGLVQYWHQVIRQECATREICLSIALVAMIRFDELSEAVKG